MRFLAQDVSTNTYLDIMAQYRPVYQAFDISQLARPVDGQEFYEAIDLAHQQGLCRLDKVYTSLPLKLILK